MWRRPARAVRLGGLVASGVGVGLAILQARSAAPAAARTRRAKSAIGRLSRRVRRALARSAGLNGVKTAERIPIIAKMRRGGALDGHWLLAGILYRGGSVLPVLPGSLSISWRVRGASWCRRHGGALDHDDSELASVALPPAFLPNAV